MRTVRAGIPRPDYAATGEPSSRASRAIRTPEEIDAMRVAGRVAAEALIEVGNHVRPGVTSDELDRIGHEFLVDHGAYPSTLGYPGGGRGPAFTKSLCTSVNEVICHGIPDSRKLLEGDVVNVDVTAFIEGVHGDTNATFVVGEVDHASRDLIRITRQAMHAGIATVRPGSRINEIGRAIEAAVKGGNYGVVREFIGHGIGDQFHTSLQIPHYYQASARTVIEEGMTFTIEPMITIGSPALYVWDDDWTAVTLSGQRCAQFEHTLLVTSDGVEILTLPDGTPPAEELFAP